MKIAIVYGGFDGVRRQMQVWNLEREVEDAEARLQARVEQTAATRSRLRNLQNDLAKARLTLPRGKQKPLRPA